MKSHIAFALVFLGAGSAFPGVAGAQPSSSVQPGPAAAASAPAGSDDALQAADELFGLMSGSITSDMTSSMLGQMWPAVETSLRARIPNIDDATLADLRGQIQKLMLDFVSGVLKQAPTIYAKSFTAQEMRDIISFYRTPTGAKALRTLPQISAEISALMLPQIPALQQKVGATLVNVLQAHGFKLNP